MATKEYEVGDIILLTGTFTDATHTLVDPTTVTVKVSDPTGTITILTYAGGTVARQSLGVYTATFTAAKSGPHHYEFASTGPVQRALSSGFSVKLTPFI